MMMTADELTELTGYKSAQKQVAWLKARGWIFELNRLGQPKVDREYYRFKMGNPAGAEESKTVGPNWDAI